VNEKYIKEIVEENKIIRREKNDVEDYIRRVQ